MKNYKDLKILSVRTYQAVKLNTKVYTYFTTLEALNGRPKTNIEIIEGVGVLITTEIDTLIVPFPNIAEINIDTKEKIEIREKRQKDLKKPAKAQNVKGIKKDPIGAKRL